MFHITLFLGDFQVQSQVKLIAVIQCKGHKAVNNCGKACIQEERLQSVYLV